MNREFIIICSVVCIISLSIGINGCMANKRVDKICNYVHEIEQKNNPEKIDFTIEYNSPGIFDKGSVKLIWKFHNMEWHRKDGTVIKRNSKGE
jgi:hypothetical protein